LAQIVLRCGAINALSQSIDHSGTADRDFPSLTQCQSQHRSNLTELIISEFQFLPYLIFVETVHHLFNCRRTVGLSWNGRVRTSKRSLPFRPGWNCNHQEQW
jgi:hypothetical protein